MTDKPRVAFDSNILSFFVDATNGTYTAPPDDPLRGEKIAAFWLFLFCDTVIVPTVTEEAQEIDDPARLDSHLRAIGVQFQEFLPDDEEVSALRRRAQELARHHPNGENDCLIVAAAEMAGVPIVVSYDNKFRKRLAPFTSVRLMTPTECCKALGIPDSTKPHWTPGSGNPLSRQTWWHWPGYEARGEFR